MGIIVNLDEHRSELQKKIASELQKKTKGNSLNGDIPDGVNDSTLVENTNPTGSLRWLKLVIIIGSLFGMVALSVMIVNL